jgi:hypothetical protein
MFFCFFLLHSVRLFECHIVGIFREISIFSLVAKLFTIILVANARVSLDVVPFYPVWTVE